MPCFSARNLRFTNSQAQFKTQQPTQSNSKFQLNAGAGKERACTAVRNYYHAPELNLPTTTRSLDQQYHKTQNNKLRNIKSYEVCNWSPGSRENVNLYGAPPRSRKLAFGHKQPTLPQRELHRLKTAAKVTTLEQQLDMLMKQENETKRLEEETRRTRERFKQLDEARKRAEEAKVQQEDLFGAEEKLQVLERAELAKHEQEEEVKRVNRIILNAKCHAVRDAQIQEKQEMEKTQKNDDLRLERVVLERAKQSLDEEDAHHEQQKVEKLRYASEIKKQLSEREKLRFLEAERCEEEAKMLRKANEAIKRDEERQAQLERERRLKLRDELNRIAEMSNLFKRMLCEQEREAEMRVAAYQRERGEREAQLRLEKKLAKEAFERKQQRLYTLAQKILESRSHSDEQRYIREQEQIEREYRQKEKEAVLRKKKIESELREARELQLQETKHRQALQIARSEEDFNSLVERLKREEAKQKRSDEERERQRKCYRADIINQMNGKELERRHLEEVEKSRASAWRESERQRDKNIRAVIIAKIHAMRDACLPDKYIKEVEMQLKKIASVRPAAVSTNN